MNIRILLLAISYTVVLAASVPVKIQNFSSADAATVNRQIQETTISLETEALRHPHFLSISTSSTKTKLTGQIKLDGKSIWTFNNSTKIDLSPYLDRGIHKIDISGRYLPTDDSIRVELIGPDTQISQQTSGSGAIAQTLILEIN